MYNGLSVSPYAHDSYVNIFPLYAIKKLELWVKTKTQIVVTYCCLGDSKIRGESGFIEAAKKYLNVKVRMQGVGLLYVLLLLLLSTKQHGK